VQNADRLLQNHDLNGAETQLRKAAQLAPQDGFIHMQLADIYVQQGRMNDAAAELILAKQRGVAEEFRAALLSQVMYTKQEFGDVQLHLEWATPAEVVGKDQGRGNSGCRCRG